MGMHQNMTGAERVARHRASKRAQGLRLIQIWVPDMNNPAMRSSIEADAAALAAQGSRWADVVDDAEAMTAEVLDDVFTDDVNDGATDPRS